MNDNMHTPHSAYRDRNYSRMPKTDFPRFDGENPKWWKTVCKKYFHTYDVGRDSWVSFATMHFTGNAALWLSNYEAVNDIDSWEELVVAVHQKFGKNKHLKHLDELERHKQKGTLEQYYKIFESLKTQSVNL